MIHNSIFEDREDFELDLYTLPVKRDRYSNVQHSGAQDVISLWIEVLPPRVIKRTGTKHGQFSCRNHYLAGYRLEDRSAAIVMVDAAYDRTIQQWPIDVVRRSFFADFDENHEPRVREVPSEVVERAAAAHPESLTHSVRRAHEWLTTHGDQARAITWDTGPFDIPLLGHH